MTSLARKGVARQGRGAVLAALLLGLVFGGLAFGLAAPVRAGVFNPETFTLSNGMQVVVVTNRIAPVVNHMVWYRVGAADEPPGRSGVAHYLEHLMFLGTTQVPGGRFSDVVARNGGQENAFTGADYTGYFQEIAVDRLPEMMRLEADRMVNLTVAPEQALTERDVITEERRERIDNDPSARLSEQMSAALYQNHPYGTPIIGWEQEMAALTLDDAMAFYRTWYAPNNAILAVSGDIDAATLRPLAEATYGRIPARPVPDRVRPQEPPRAAERRVVLRDDAVQLASWRRYYLAPSYGTGEDSTSYALEVLTEILGEGTSSRLYRSLVIEQQLAVGAGTSYSPRDLDDTIFLGWATPRPGVDPAAVEAAFDQEIARLLRDGVTAEELAAAKDRLVIQAIYARDSVAGPARVLGAALAVDRTVEQVEAWPDRIAAVTADQVLAAARAVLTPERSVTGLLLPGDGTGPATAQAPAATTEPPLSGNPIQ